MVIIKVSNVGSPDALTQNLDLDGFNIFGSGTVTATAFIGDGSGLTNVGGGGGIVDGSNYRINIAGDDSSIIVNSATNTLTGVFVGDGGGLTNILLEQLDDVLVLSPTNDQVLIYSNGFWINSDAADGIVEGSNYRINVVSNDSTTLIDIDTNTLTGDLNSNVITYSTNLSINNSNTGANGQLTLNNSGEAQYLKFIRTDTGTATNQTLGLIGFDQVDETGTTTYTSMAFWHSGIYIANSSTGTFNPTNYLGFEDGNLCIGDYSAAAGYRLDVRGNAVIVDGSLRFNESRDLIDISPPSTYELTVNIATNKLAFYDGVDWREIISSILSDNVTDFPGAIVVGGLTEAERDFFGQDSIDITGAMIYNSTADRFEFFQAGSWVTLNNNGTSAGQVLTWDGAKWEATAPASGGSVVSADQLDGFDGPYYLDYNNFTNTPVLFDGAFSSLSGKPTTLIGYGITDAATSAQGALADTALQSADIGSFTFTGTTLDTSDSSGIVVTPAVTFSSDVTVQNSLTVTNKITVDTLEVANLITAPTAGTPEISSDGAILLTAATRVEISSSPLKMAGFTTAERDVLSAENGDMIYNTSTNKFQGYANGIWVDLH